MVTTVTTREKFIESLCDTKPSARVQRLRERWFTYKRTLDTNRIRIYTRAFKETEGDPREIRLAKAFAAVVKEIPINIYPEELIVGNKDVVPRASFLYTDWDGPLMEQELKGISNRPPGDTYEVNAEDEKLLREEIFPYWRGPDGTYPETEHRWLYNLLDDELKYVMYVDPEEYPPTGEHSVLTMHYRTERDWGHMQTPPLLLEKGLLGLKKMAEDRLKRFRSEDLLEVKPGDFEPIRQIHFLESVIIALQAAAKFGPRHAQKLRDLSRRETDELRKVELENMAEICEWVPANPPRTFHEAIQAVWFYQVLGRIESFCLSNGFGRVDQWLWPYYENDIKEGRLTKQFAQELLDSWFIKIAEGGYYVSNQVARYMTAGQQYQIMTIGGVIKGGLDGTNELSHMLIDAFMHTRLYQPTMSVRLHSQTPESFMIKAAKLVALGTGNPSFANDECVVPSLMSIPQGAHDPPMSMDVAREYCFTGCTEAWVPDYPGFVIHCYLNTAACMELSLNNGMSRIHMKRLGLETGNPRKFQTFDEVKEAFEKQVRYFTRFGIRGANLGEYAEAEHTPTVFQSAAMRDCIERGLPKERGGARYNYGGYGIQTGVVDAGDSLAAIKKVVFDDKKASMSELIDALDANFKGYEDLRRMLLEAPKFGNDDNYVDMLTRWVLDLYADESRRHRNPRGGCYVGGTLGMSMNVPFGEVVGALPSGRKAREPLADGNSPYMGMDKQGITAVFNSEGKLDHMNQTSTLWNLKIDPSIFEEGDRGFKLLGDLLRVFVDKKIWHLQINCVSADTLRAAQSEPEKYGELIVRVAGYTAFFTDLTKALQDVIIARTEHRLG